LAGLLGALLDVVGDGAEALVLDARRREEHAGEEADGQCADRQAERVLLGHALGAARLVLDVTAVRRRAGDAVLDAGHAVLGARRDVGLVAERADGLAHLGAGVLYLPADPVWVFAHWMSSFTVSTVWGAGGVAARSALRPAAARAAATAAHSRVTISA